MPKGIKNSQQKKKCLTLDYSASVHVYNSSMLTGLFS